MSQHVAGAIALSFSTLLLFYGAHAQLLAFLSAFFFTYFLRRFLCRKK